MNLKSLFNVNNENLFEDFYKIEKHYNTNSSFQEDFNLFLNELVQEYEKDKEVELILNKFLYKIYEEFYLKVKDSSLKMHLLTPLIIKFNML